MTPQSIGIFGGTFDPVHLGHLRTALEVREQLDLAQIRFIPTGFPPHRPAPCLKPGDRLELVRMAIAREPGFVLDARESLQLHPAYTINTLESLRTEMGMNLAMGLIMGMDAFATLPQWHRWREFLSLAHIIVAHRPGISVPLDGPVNELVRDCQEQATSRNFQTKSHGCIFLVPVTAMDISSTDIRRRLSEGRSARFLVTDNVWENLQGQYDR